jgi:ribose-phosphate pyrophosphokinase
MRLSDGIAVFALDADRDYGERVARRLEAPLAQHEEREFEDGEHKARPLVRVTGLDAVVIASLHGDERFSANDKLCRMLFLIGALRDAGSASITAVAPYLCYSRKDRRTQPQDPVTTRYVAQVFEAMGVDRVVTMDVHNIAAFENAFRCRTIHLEPHTLFVRALIPMLGKERVVVVAPDVGATKRAEQFRRELAASSGEEPSTAFMGKRRSGGVMTSGALYGEVEGRVAVIVDDLISTGGTLVRVAKACREAGATRVIAAATHGLFSRESGAVLSDVALDHLVVSDTIGRKPAALMGKLTVLDSTALVAEAIVGHVGGP